MHRGSDHNGGRPSGAQTASVDTVGAPDSSHFEEARTSLTTTQTRLYAFPGTASHGGTARTSAGLLPPSATYDAARGTPELRFEEASDVLGRAIRQAEELRSEAVATRNAIVDAARAEAAEIVRRARADAEQIRAGASADAEAIRSSQDDLLGADVEVVSAPQQPTDQFTLVRSGDISRREFPRARRGADPESVRKWLEVVELSYAILEEELDRARSEWERALELLARTRAYLVMTSHAGSERRITHGFDAELERARRQWERSVETLSRVRTAPSRSNFQGLLTHAAEYEASLARRWRGYCPAQVGRLLDSLVTELARLHMQVDMLRAENEQLRDRALWQVADPARFLPVLAVNGSDAPRVS